MDQATSSNMHRLEIGEYSHNSGISVGELDSLAVLPYKCPLSHVELIFLVRYFISAAFTSARNQFLSDKNRASLNKLAIEIFGKHLEKKSCFYMTERDSNPQPISL